MCICLIKFNKYIVHLNTAIRIKEIMVKKVEISKELLRLYMYYDFKVGLKAAESHRRLCAAFGEDVVHYNTVQSWFKQFSSGNYDIEDQYRSGRPSEIDD